MFCVSGASELIRFAPDGWHDRFSEGFTAENVACVSDALAKIWAGMKVEDQNGQAKHSEAKSHQDRYFQNQSVQDTTATTAAAVDIALADVPDAEVHVTPQKKIYISYDHRLRSKQYAKLCAHIIASHGLVALLTEDACPTPILCWGCAHDPHALGAVMFTASARSCEFGGMMIRGRDGGPAGKSFIRALERTIIHDFVQQQAPYQTIDLLPAYTQHLTACLNLAPIAKKHPRIVLDSMYGATMKHVAQIFRAAGAEVIEIHHMPRSDFGGIHPIPCDPWADECEQAVIKHKADFGLLFDGDGDRFGLVSSTGELVAIPIYCCWLLDALVAGNIYHPEIEHPNAETVHTRLTSSGQPEQMRFVLTSSCSALLLRQAERLGLDSTQVPVGFDRMYQELEQHDVICGVEEYGGISVPAHLMERDAIFVSLLLVSWLCSRSSTNTDTIEGTEGADAAENGATLSKTRGSNQASSESASEHHLHKSCLSKRRVDIEGERERLKASIGTMRYARRDLYLDPAYKQAFTHVLPGVNPREMAGLTTQEVSHADGLRLQFENDAWILMRPSRNAAVVRVYAEADTEQLRDHLLHDACKLVKSLDIHGHNNML